MSQAARLCRLIGEIDDSYITAAVDVPKPKMLWLKITAVAACAALVIGIVHVSVVSDFNTACDSIVYPSETPMDISGSFVAAQFGEQLASKTYINYSQLVSRATLIICADVENIYQKETDQGYVIYAEMRVVETLKGDTQSGSTVYVQDNAGRDKRGQTVSLYDDPLFEKGNRVLLFLYIPQGDITTEDGQQLYAVWGSVGKFFYDKDGKYHWSMLYSDRYLTESTISMMLRDPKPKTLEEMKQLVDNAIDVTQSPFASFSRSPRGGEVFYRPHYSGFLEELQTKHSQFLISFYVYDQDGVPLSCDKTKEECVRLASLGYHIYQKPSTQYQCDHEIVGVFTIDELNSLEFCENYGYCFGDIWNSGNDFISKMDESLRIEG